MLTSLPPSQSQHSSGSLPFCTPGDNPAAGCEACGSCVACGLVPQHPFETSHHSTPCKNSLFIGRLICTNYTSSFVQAIHPMQSIPCNVMPHHQCNKEFVLFLLFTVSTVWARFDDVTDRTTVPLAEHQHSAIQQHVARPQIARSCDQQAYLQSSMAPPGIFSILTYFLMSISLWPPLTSDITHVTASSASSCKQQL